MLYVVGGGAGGLLEKPAQMADFPMGMGKQVGNLRLQRARANDLTK